MKVLRRFAVLTTTWIIALALLSSGTAGAQEDEADDEAPTEVASYGDTELIDTLRRYGFLDEWIEASPVSPQASLLRVSGSAGYQAQRQRFLNSLDAWADRTERVRSDLARIDAAQANADRLGSAVVRVRDALVLDDRLAQDSETLRVIEGALAELAGLAIPEHVPGESEDPLVLAEVQLVELRDLAQAEFLVLNDRQAATQRSGVEAFAGYENLAPRLAIVEELIGRSRAAIRPAREQSEQLVTSALDQIPNLHALRMTGSSDVNGLSVVTVDAYIRAAARSTCAVDWALLAGIGKVESNHGRIGGATVSRSGQVSTAILGPILDGGATERGIEDNRLQAEHRSAVEATVAAARTAARAAVAGTSLGVLRDVDDVDLGNGFAVVVDTDDGRLDGNDEWDRAVGPMQFIPETWSRWATDGNGDGISDPNNLYDAAAAAARFLCDLSTTRGSSPSSFLLGYNQSVSYVSRVLSTAAGFRATALPAA